MTKSNWGGNDLFHLTDYSPFFEEAMARTPVWNLEVGTKTEAME